MTGSSEILKVRVLLCFMSRNLEDCTVTAIAKTLGEEKYTISRVLIALEKEGLINRQYSRKPCLTDAGIQMGNLYLKRVECVIEYLIQKGVDIVSARHDALHWALYSSDASMELLKEAQEKMRMKQYMNNQKQFNGKALCKMMENGVYQFHFVIYKEFDALGNMMSKVNYWFENPCILSVENGVGKFHLRAYKTIDSLMYCDNGDYISAERRGNVFSIPVDALRFICIGTIGEKLLHGSVPIKITPCGRVSVKQKETVEIFTVIV